jgi:hypothetical protein
MGLFPVLETWLDPVFIFSFSCQALIIHNKVHHLSYRRFATIDTAHFLLDSMET